MRYPKGYFSIPFASTKNNSVQSGDLIWVLVQVLAAPLMIQHPVNMPEKAANEGSEPVPLSPT